MVQVREWKLQALTDIWTGDARRGSDRLIPTGIMGSLRWWYEVLVRGLGGKACDPTVKGVRCQYEPRDPRPPESQLCVACYLFGCTGWARRFRLMIVDESGHVVQRQIKSGQTFILRLIPLRPIRDEEWCLLDATLRLIADCGAIGGKTVLKPSDEPNRQNAFHHRDFGLIEVLERPDGLECERTHLEAYVRDDRWRKQFDDKTFAWASLRNFWCVKGRYLARQNANYSSFNRVIGRRMEKNRAQSLFRNTEMNRWLAGHQQESKKVFSFKEPADARRTFGFRNPGLVEFDEIKRRLSVVWEEDFKFLTGEEILQDLCSTGGDS